VGWRILQSSAFTLGKLRPREQNMSTQGQTDLHSFTDVSSVPTTVPTKSSSLFHQGMGNPSA
jgi:hypothetical protein